MLNLSPVQNFLTRRAASILSGKIGTAVQVNSVEISFFNHLVLNDVLVKDKMNDTLLYAGKLELHLSDLVFSHKTPVLHYLGLKNIYLHLYRPRTSDVWNYAYLEDFFASDKKKPDPKQDFEFDLKKIALENVRFHMDDNWVGWDMNYDVAKLDLDTRTVDMKKKSVFVDDINIDGANVAYRDYTGGRPPERKPPHSDTEQFDPTPFNKDNWVIRIRSTIVNNSAFSINWGTTVPKPGEFDPDHIVINGIRINIKDAGIIGDTITGDLQHLEAAERSGVAIKSMRSKVSVSPIASVCANLLLETNYSKVKNYYAMRYRHFPDFLNYIDSVRMEGNLKDAVVDIRDVACFAPVLKTFPQITLRGSGSGNGTVANLSGRDLVVTDGVNFLKGNGTIKGLPDIYKSRISFTQAHLITNGEGILKYVPGLRNSEDLALEKLSYAYFTGDYSGFIDSFSLKGMITTNLGNIDADVRMFLPGFKPDSAMYAGYVVVNNFMLGDLLNKKDFLGSISLDEKISGFSFLPSNGHVELDGNISSIDLNGYSYAHITTIGSLENRQFSGFLNVADTNLAMNFNGAIDFRSARVNVKAKASVTKCNFRELKFTENLFTASADFDLDCTGSNIDNFSGFARLGKINIRREQHKLALDSVTLIATGDSTNKVLTIQSNAAYAKIKGNYRISKLPASFQYYLARYLPDYVKTPAGTAPEQDLEFKINTYSVDSIFAITVPWVRGFDSSYISGIFSTYSKNLSVVASIPNGTLGKVHMNNVAVSAQGNLNTISVNTTIDNVVLGDSIISGSVGFTASLGNDLLNFNIATTTPDSTSSITLNGEIRASHDTLYLAMNPSSFYLNQVRWDIAMGSSAVYSGKYLSVDNLNITSALQKISVTSPDLNGAHPMLLNLENIDLAQLGALTGLNYYQPDGRINGTVSITNLLSAPYFSGNIRATNVKLGTDTIGGITIISDYDAYKKLAILDPQSGIYFSDGSSITGAGRISFDSNINQQLDGVIQFNHAPVACTSPFISGVFSRLGGTVDGKVLIGGRSYEPNIKGDLEVHDAAFLLDYMGVAYKIPYAKVHVSNTRIDLGDVTVLDQYQNEAHVSGYFAHQLFRDMRMHINARSEKIEALRLSHNDNIYFYGYATVGMDSFTVSGPFNDISLNAYNVYPADKSHIYIPMATTGDAGSYSYVSFKTYGKAIEKPVKKNPLKINLDIDANMNNLAIMTILLDPVTGDAIDARGEGNIQLKMPANNDMRITGGYNIESGTYTFTFKQLLNYSKQFKLNSGSTIYFKGPFAATTLDVFATYTAKARLFDLLSATEQASMSPSGTSGSSDLLDAKQLQAVNVLLHMQDVIFNPKLSFDLSLDNKGMESNPAYTKLMLINQDDRQKLDQVASLLLTGSFMSQEGLFGKNSGSTLALNNISQILSGTVSTGLTNIVSKLTGERKLNINVNYQNYNYSDAGSYWNRNQLKGTISRNFLNDRLIVEAGGKSDWSASVASSYNFSGDFKIQYLLTPSGKLRLNGFSTSDFDVTLDKQIVKNGVGISWRKAFDNFGDFFGKEKTPGANKRKDPGFNNLKPTDTSLSNRRVNLSGN